MRIRFSSLFLIVLAVECTVVIVGAEPPRTSWRQQSHLIVEGKVNDERFGNSVSISGDGQTLVAGAYRHDEPGRESQGAAYVFVRSGEAWIQQAMLVSLNPGQADMFGYSVCICADGNRIVVGAVGADTGTIMDRRMCSLASRENGHKGYS